MKKALILSTAILLAIGSAYSEVIPSVSVENQTGITPPSNQYNDISIVSAHTNQYCNGNPNSVYLTPHSDRPNWESDFQNLKAISYNVPSNSSYDCLLTLTINLNVNNALNINCPAIIDYGPAQGFTLWGGSCSNKSYQMWINSFYPYTFQIKPQNQTLKTL